MKHLLRTILAFYGGRLPYHPGKWRVVEALHAGLRLAPADAARAFPVRRRGLRWELRLDCCIQRALFYLRVYERAETRFLEQWWRPGMTVLDIGSNFGYYSLLATHHVGQGRVVAFEPYAPNRAQLERNLTLNGFTRVTVEPRALSDAPGTLRFEIPPPSCLGVGRLLDEAPSSARSVEVDVTTLDQWASEQPLERLDFIKLDVEGAETRVLRGGRNTLDRFHPMLLVEINPEGLASFHSSPAELVGLLHELGYGLFRVRRGRLVRLQLDAGSDYDALFGDHGNTLAIHGGSAA